MGIGNNATFRNNPAPTSQRNNPRGNAAARGGTSVPRNISQSRNTSIDSGYGSQSQQLGQRSQPTPARNVASVPPRTTVQRPVNPRPAQAAPMLHQRVPYNDFNNDDDDPTGGQSVVCSCGVDARTAEHPLRRRPCALARCGCGLRPRSP